MTAPPVRWFVALEVCAALLMAAFGLSGVALAEEPSERIEERARHLIDPAGLPAVPGALYGLDLSLVAFVNGQWDRQSISNAVRQAADILAQCGVRLAPPQLRVIEAPRRYRFYFTPVSRHLARVLSLPRPAAYFADDTFNQPAFDAEAIGRGNSRTRPELEGSVWLTHGIREPGIALAHELVHVLMDSGAHSEQAGNLMRTETAAANVELDQNQCARLTSVGAQQGLLRLLQR